MGGEQGQWNEGRKGTNEISHKRQCSKGKKREPRKQKKEETPTEGIDLILISRMPLFIQVGGGACSLPYPTLPGSRLAGASVGASPNSALIPTPSVQCQKPTESVKWRTTIRNTYTSSGFLGWSSFDSN